MRGTAQPAWQHDWEQRDAKTMTVFDNEAAPKVRDESRALTLRVDERRKTLTPVKAYVHRPMALSAGTQGNNEILAGGDHFVGWGSQGYFSQFTPGGKAVFDARIARGQDTYRAYRFGWVGTPSGLPSVAATPGGRSVYASWNGATRVASWEVLAGAAKDALSPSGSAKRDGFETRIGRPEATTYVAVAARAADGTVLARSRTIKVPSRG